MARRGSATSRGRSSSRRSSAGRLSSVPTPQLDPNKRIWIMALIFAGMALLVVLKMGWLTIVQGSEYAQAARDSRLASIDVPARRGTIYDRNGSVLATSVNATTVYCNPNEVTDVKGEAAQIAAILGGNQADYIDALGSKETSFAYVVRKADPDAADTLKALNLDGLYYLNDSKRVYPKGQIAGQVVGMCDIDGNGLSGLELYYNDILAGTNGQIQVERGANGYPIAGGVYTSTAAQNGEDIVVSLDLEMQEYLETRLAEQIKTVEGKAGSAVLYDGATGEIYAIASTPYLDPSNRENIEEGSTELKPVSMAFEPGSIFKTVSATALLESNTMKAEDTIFCPAALPADEYIITDAHERGDQTMSLRQIITESSNIGISLSTEKLGFGPLYDAIERYGLTTETGIDYPGESSGFSTKPDDWSKIQSYNVTFGQGITVTPLQMVRFYGALVNNGVACTPHLLISKPQTAERTEWPTEQIIKNTEAIEPMVSMLQSVVEEGTGVDAQIEGFAPAGKTGTAEFAQDDGTYKRDAYNISFVGFLPNTNSDLVCFVGVTDVPADRITTPAFKDIMTFAINRYHVGAN